MECGHNGLLALHWIEYVKILVRRLRGLSLPITCVRIFQHLYFKVTAWKQIHSACGGIGPTHSLRSPQPDQLMIIKAARMPLWFATVKAYIRRLGRHLFVSQDCLTTRKILKPEGARVVSFLAQRRCAIYICHRHETGAKLRISIGQSGTGTIV